MAMAPQDILPPPVQQVAATQRLGTFLKAYKTTLANSIASTIFLGVVGVLACAGGIFIPDVEVSGKVIILLFGLLFLGGAISTLYAAIQMANRQIYLFQQGMIISKKDQVQAFPWDQAAEVWQSITRNYRNGSYVGTSYSYKLRRVDGYQLNLDNMTKDIAELGPAVAKGVAQELVPRAFHSIQAGQTLTFTPFSVSLQGITKGNETIPWSQVQAVDVNRGYVTVKKAGNSRKWGTVAVAKIPNYLVFTVVADVMIRQAAGSK